MGRRGKYSGKNNSGTALVIGLIITAVAWKYVVPILIFGAVAFVFYKMANSKNVIESSKAINPGAFNKMDDNVGVTISLSSGGYGFNQKAESDSNAIFCDNFTKIQIGNYSFSPYLIYLSDKKTKLPHVINRSLSIGNGATTNEKISYYPSYSEISQDARATYLHWLSTDRSDVEIDIGYVFLYFYGLEFRAVFEDKNHNEIYKEVLRLRSVYANCNSSFNTYSSRLLYWLILKIPNIENLSENNSKEIESVLNNVDRHRDLDITSFLIKLNEPNCDEYLFAFYLSKQVAIRDYRGSIESIEKEFKELFILKLKQENKPKHQTNVRNRAYQYTSCSSTRFESRLPFQSFSLTSEKALANLWDECQFALKAYRKEKEAQNINSFFFLPPSLLENSKEVSIESFKKLLPTEDYQVYDLAKLLSSIGVGLNEKIGVTVSKKLTYIISNFDFFIEPDPGITGKAFKSDSKVIIFKKKTRLVTMDNSKYTKATLLLDLGLSIAITSESIDQKESDHVFQFICKSLDLNALEKERLQHRLEISLLEKKNNLAGLKKMTASMSPEESHAISKFLFSIAMIDGALEQSEVKALQKTYKSLGFPETKLEDLKTEHAQRTGQPILIKEAVKSPRKGSSIPSMEIKVTEPAIINLNSNALKEAFADAEEVSRILATVFVNDEKIEQATDEPIINEEDAAPLSTSIQLTKSEQDLLDYLAEKTTWDCEEVETKCRELKLMYGSAINSINEWSESLYEKPVLEEDGPKLIVHSELLKQGVKSA